jgi:hypothetical protein
MNELGVNDLGIFIGIILSLIILAIVWDHDD